MPLLPRSTRDDRGNRVPLRLTARQGDRLLMEHLVSRTKPDPDVHATHPQREKGPDTALKRVGRVCAMIATGAIGIGAMMAGLFGALMGAIAVICIPGVVIALAIGYPAHAGVLGTLALSVPTALVAVLYRGFDAPRRTSSTLAQNGLCGACGYVLSGLEPAEDGHIVCPECGAAWKPATAHRTTCQFCKESLAGAVVGDDGGVRCDGCGARYELFSVSAGNRERAPDAAAANTQPPTPIS